VIASLALTSLSRRPLRTFLTALGIAVAVASTVIFLSLGEGLRQAFSEELGGIGPDLQVSYGLLDGSFLTAAPELPVTYRERLLEHADRFGIRAITPVSLYVRGAFASANAFVFYGLPPAVDPSHIYTNYRVEEGRGLTPEEGRLEAVAGIQAARRAGLGIGDTLRLNPRAEFVIVGLASAGGGLIENAFVVPLPSLQEAMGTTELVTLFALELEPSRDPARVARELGELFPDLTVQTRSDLSSVFDRGMQISDVVRLGISAIALIVGAIAVANTMLMSVFERTREFGVVRAVGARPRFLFGLVLIESILLSLLGALAGVAIGHVGAGVVNLLAVDAIGLEVAAVTPRLVAFAVAVAAAVGLLAGLLPAARAARIPIAVAVARE
jgi:putative ABC transport system permease protein